MNIQDKLKNHEEQVKKYRSLLAFNQDIESARKKLDRLIGQHDDLAKELGEKPLIRKHRLKKAQYEELRKIILASCADKPVTIFQIFGEHHNDYTENAIRTQVGNLVEDGELEKLGDRGPSVRYIVPGILREKLNITTSATEGNNQDNDCDPGPPSPLNPANPRLATRSTLGAPEKARDTSLAPTLT